MEKKPPNILKRKKNPLSAVPCKRTIYKTVINSEQETQYCTCFASPGAWRRPSLHVRHMKWRVLLVGTRLTYASGRQRTDVALEVRYSSYIHHVQFAKHNVQENVLDWWKMWQINTYTNNILTSVKQYRTKATARFKHFPQLNTFHLRVRTLHYESHYRSYYVHCSHTHPGMCNLLNWRLEFLKKEWGKKKQWKRM
jgi:hypothetical protein